MAKPGALLEPSPWVRAAVSASAPLLAWLLMLVPMPLEEDALSRLSSGTHARSLGEPPLFSLFSTATILLFPTSFLIVEAVAALVPRWRPLRFAGAPGRLALARATLVLFFLLALFNGFGMGKFFTSFGHGSAWQLPTLTITVVAAAAAWLWLAGVVGRNGLAHGVLTLLVAGALVRTAFDLRGAMANKQPLSPLELAICGAAAAVVVIATARVVRPPTGARGGSPAAYRDAPRAALPLSIPVPACSIVAVTASYPLFNLLRQVAHSAESAAAFGLFDSQAGATWVRAGIALGLGVVLCRVLAAPAAVAGVTARATGSATVDALEPAVRARNAALLPTLGFVALLVGAEEIARRLGGFGFEAVTFALATTITLDALGELRARRALGPLVAVWPEVRPYALEPARAALAAAGIASHVRDERSRALLNVFGPYAPSEVLVAPADVEAARACLAHVLPLDAPEPERSGGARRAEPKTRAQDGGLLASVAVAVALALGALSFGSSAGSPMGERPFSASAQPPTRPCKPVSLAFVEVDDDIDPFRMLPDAAPRGARLELENAPVGPGKTHPVHYIFFISGRGESLAATRARAQTEVDALLVQAPLPEGDRVGFETVDEYDEAQQRYVPIGVRTYVLRGAAVLTEADVKDATANEQDDPAGWHVALELTPAGGERFFAFTKAHVMRRFAIVVDGLVTSAPRILQGIRGGHAQITMGKGELEQQEQEARDLANGLRAAGARNR